MALCTQLNLSSSLGFIVDETVVARGRWIESPSIVQV